MILNPFTLNQSNSGFELLLFQNGITTKSINRDINKNYLLYSYYQVNIGDTYRPVYKQNYRSELMIPAQYSENVKFYLDSFDSANTKILYTVELTNSMMKFTLENDYVSNQIYLIIFSF